MYRAQNSMLRPCKFELRLSSNNPRFYSEGWITKPEENRKSFLFGVQFRIPSCEQPEDEFQHIGATRYTQITEGMQLKRCLNNTKRNTTHLRSLHFVFANRKARLAFVYNRTFVKTLLLALDSRSTLG